MSNLKIKKPAIIDELKAMSPKDRNRAIGDLLMNNAMFIIIAIAVVGIAIAEPSFLSVPSIVNIISLTAAKLPIALGVGGCIILAGTDISDTMRQIIQNGVILYALAQAKGGSD